ncbi:MAG: hypothetical protein Q9191_005199 [Dirinaria sp. TL-2023a]
MFGALNRFISRLDSDSPAQSARNGQSAFGFQVLRNKNPEIPIEPWYDFVVGINGRQIDNADPNLFATEVRNCAGSNVSLALWSAKGQRLRNLALPVPSPSPTLGVTLQWASLALTENIWHILDVSPNSPADLAGLLPYGDYIVGTPEGAVHGEAGLGELVEDYLDRVLRLYVYNHEYGVTRIVEITPNRSWGGFGALGCVLGFGALHRLPVPLNEPGVGPGETLFETARFSNEETRPSQEASIPYQTSAAQPSNEFLVPATMDLPPPSAPPTSTSPAPPRSARKPRNVGKERSGFDDMFKEGEQKSKEEDFAPTSKSAGVPPPPKGKGGPPSSASGPPSAAMKSTEPAPADGAEVTSTQETVPGGEEKDG